MRTEWPRSVRPRREFTSQRLRRSTEASAREADHLQTSLTDESVLVRPTVAQKPDPGGPVKSNRHGSISTLASHNPGERVHGVRPVSLFGIAYCSDLEPWLLSPPLGQTPSPSLRAFLSSSAHRRDDYDHHCIKQMSVVARGSQRILPSPIAWVCFVALPFNLRRVPNAAF